MITLTIKLFAQFRVGRFKVEQRDYQQPINARQILVDLGIAEQELGVLMVNGRHADIDLSLSDGDTVGIFPLVGGG